MRSHLGHRSAEAIIATCIAVVASSPQVQGRVETAPAAPVPQTAMTSPTPETPRKPTADEVLETHCASCHQTGRPGGSAPQGDLGNIAYQHELAVDQARVVPGVPDASPLYHVLLDRHRPLKVFGSGAGPTTAEIEAVRDWIASLDVPRGDCRLRRIMHPRDEAALIQDWDRFLGPTVAADVRYVSLSALANACIDDAELAVLREAATSLLGAASKVSTPAVVETVGDQSLLLAVRLRSLGWLVDDWDALVSPRGEADARVVPADWLADALNVAPLLAVSETLIGGLEPTRALRRIYRDDVRLVRAAAERGEPAGYFDLRLAGFSGDGENLARRLRQGALTRSEWETLKRRLDGRSDFVRSGLAPFRLALWTDDMVFRSGNILSVNAMSTVDCHLTVVAVDPDGRASVLFPNELETDNRIEAGRVVRVPSEDAGYQFRLTEAGDETLVGICQTVSERPVGIGHDFTHARFTELGDWRQFMAAPDAAEAKYMEQQKSLQRFRTRPRERRRSKDQPVSVPVAAPATGPEMTARTAISVRVE